MTFISVASSKSLIETRGNQNGLSPKATKSQSWFSKWRETYFGTQFHFSDSSGKGSQKNDGNESDAKNLRHELEKNRSDSSITTCALSFSPSGDEDSSSSAESSKTDQRLSGETVIAEEHTTSKGRFNTSSILPEDFERVSALGRGSVGHVYLVREKSSEKMMAMKGMH